MAKAPATKTHPLEALAKGDPKKVIALMLWKARHREPDMYVRIDEKDLSGFEASVKYQKLEPDVLIERPEGMPAQEAQPARGNRRAVPARPATPPKPFVIVTLVEKDTKNVIRSIENNEGDFDKSQQQAAVRKARDGAQGMVDRLMAQARSGDFSLSDVQDTCNALLILATAQE